MKYLTVIKRTVSKASGSQKVVFELKDKNYIETALFQPFPGYPQNLLHLCISCQVGCAMGCTHCATGQKIGFKRNLGVEEILEQIEYFKPVINKYDLQISFMGMGDSGACWKIVIEAIKKIDKNFSDINIKVIDMSTIGFLDFVKKHANSTFSKRFKVGLHFSLMHPLTQERKKLIVKLPSTPSEMVKEGSNWAKGQKVQVDFNMVMFKNFNDSKDIAQKLIELFLPYLDYYPDKYPPVVTIATYNEFEGSKWKGLGLSKREANNYAELLRKIIKTYGIDKKLQVKRFDSRGVKINAGCGNMAYKMKVSPF